MGLINISKKFNIRRGDILGFSLRKVEIVKYDLPAFTDSSFIAEVNEPVFVNCIPK